MATMPSDVPSALHAVIDRLDVGSLVPDRHAGWRSLICDAVACFLEHLPRRRQDEIAGHQLALGPTPSPALRAVTLMHDCPSLHKLGQVVARHRALDAEFRRLLQRLESMEPRTPLGDVLSFVESELAPSAARYSLRVEKAALAEGSVAVVVPVSWREAESAPRQRGVVKVLKPGVARRVTEDLAAFERVAERLDQRRGDGSVPALEYRETFDTVAEILTHELRSDLEQTNLAAAVEQYGGSGTVLVPAVLPFCTPQITAMERIDGVKVTDAAGLSDVQRARLAGAIVDSLVADVVFSPAARVMFHADPHAGNLFVTPDRQLAILDWSLTGTLGKPERVCMSRIIGAAVVHDATGISQAIAELAAAPPNETALRAAADDALREIRGGAIPGPAWLMRLLDRAASGGAARFSNDLLLFRKAVLTIEGVVADVCAETTLDGLLIAAGLQRFVTEWPRRAWAMPHCADFATHLSNAELARMLASLPAAAMRFWNGMWWDFMRGGKAMGRVDSGC